MSTPAAPTHTTESGMAEATSALASAISGASPAPTEPAVPAEPAPAPPAEPAAAAPAAPEPKVEPSGGAPAAAEPQAPEITDAAARRFLEMQGGDYNRALAKALRDSNRLAQLYRQQPELFQPGAAADPRQPLDVATATVFEEPPPVAPLAIEPPEVELDPAAIQAQVTQAVHRDDVSTGLVREWYNNNLQLQGFANQKNELQQRISYNEQKLKDPDWSPDDLRRPQLESQIMGLQQQLGLVEQREGRILMQQERLSSQFDQRSAIIQQAITQQLQRQAEEEAYSAYEQRLEAAELQKTQVEWPSALERCIKENNIPPEQVADFKRDAAREFHAAMGADPNLVIHDMYAFLSPVAKALTARLDRYHRVRSGQYAAAAITRAATPSPATGPGTPQPPVPSQFPTPDEAMAEATRYWKQQTRR